MGSRTVSIFVSKQSVINALISDRETLLSKDFTGPIQSGCIESVLNPKADNTSASIGLPASSPQKLKGIFY